MPARPDADEQQQDRHFQSHDPVLRFADQLGAEQVQPGNHDHAETDQHMFADRLPCLRQKRRAVTAKRERIQRQHHHVTQPQQHVQAAGEHAGTERAVEEGDRSAATRISDGKLRVRIRRQQRHHARQRKGHRRAAVRQLHRQPQHRKNPAPDHPADADGNHRPQPNLAVACFAHAPLVSCLPERCPPPTFLILMRISDWLVSFIISVPRC